MFFFAARLVGDENNPLGIVRPPVRADAGFVFCDLDGFSSHRPHQEKLLLLVDTSSKRQIAPIRRELKCAPAVLADVLERLSSSSGDHVIGIFALVLVPVQLRLRIEHPLTVGRHERAAHAHHVEPVVGCHRPAGFLSECCGADQKEYGDYRGGGGGGLSHGWLQRMYDCESKSDPQKYLPGPALPHPGSDRNPRYSIILAVLPMLAFQGGGGLTESLTHSPLVAMATLFGFGVLTSMTPCIYPMIPITAGILAGTGGEVRTRARTVGLTLSFVSGLALLYALMGMIAGLTGSLFGTVAASVWARLAIGNLLVVFGLVMLDVIPIAAPRRLVAWAGSLGGGSYPAVFVLGASSGIVAAPCGAPAFAVVLTWVTTTQSAVLGFVYLFVFSIGMMALLVVVGLFSGSVAALPRAGPWMVWIKKAAGVLMLGMAEYYFVLAGMVY